MPKHFLIETPQNVSVLHHEGGLRAVASADNVGDHWWVNRVLVDPPARRGSGVGTQMVKELLEAVTRQGCKELHVCPGGYDGKTKLQFKFYLKLGFTRIKGEPGLLIWRPQ